MRTLCACLIPSAKETTMSIENLIICSSQKPCVDQTEFEIVERKGIGHPDTLCDTLAEKISQAYSQYCLERYGVILRHMVDKIALSGGASKVTFGGGSMVQPVKLYLNCRFTRSFQEEEIPYMEIVKKVVFEHLSYVMPILDLDKWLVIVDNTHSAPGPGVVFREDGSTSNERQHFFDVPQKEFASFHDNRMRSNDTSTAVAYGPVSSTEQIVLKAEGILNSKEFKKLHPYVGTDIKVMAKRYKKNVDLTICVPFVSAFTPSEDFYFMKIEELRILLETKLEDCFPEYCCSIVFNTRDDAKNSDYYLTLTGSAIESGDEGVVGRGNRYNGVIPFTRHMTMEACCGKNPVYHVGKVYTAMASIISQRIYQCLGLESYTFLTSQMGRNLDDPWFACIEICGTNPDQNQTNEIKLILEEVMGDAANITLQIIHGKINLF